jgi:hypothetical protein
VTWDPWQREVLEALGHDLLERAGREHPPVPDDPLVHALLHAAGRGPEASDAAELVQGWPPAARLRGDAAAKRALWPRLRALRRGAPR